MTQDFQTLIDKSLALGASAVKPVDVSTIKRGVWPRMKCRFGCPQYGKSLCCPPYTPELPVMERFLSEYTSALLVQYTLPVTDEDMKDWQDLDKRMSNGLLHLLVAVEREALFMNFYKAFALKAGRCRLCEECNLKSCIHPQEARPSLESCGIDVMALAKDNGFDAKILTGKVEKLSVYGLVLIE